MGGSYCNNLVQSSSCSWVGANNPLKGHRCLCLTHRPHSCFCVRSCVVLLQMPLSRQLPPPPELCLGSHQVQPSGDVCCVSAPERGETRPAREQLCKSGGTQPLGRHLGEQEMASPKPIDWDSAGKAGSLWGIPPGPTQDCSVLHGVRACCLWLPETACKIPARGEAAKGTVSLLRSSRHTRNKPVLAF